jgi:excisionase family DNA binding protein
MRHLELIGESALAARLGICTASLRKRSDLLAPIRIGGRKRWFLSDVAHLCQPVDYCDSLKGDELASVLGVSVGTIYRWVQQGKLPPGRKARWSREDVENFLRALPRRKDGRACAA